MKSALSQRRLRRLARGRLRPEVALRLLDLLENDQEASHSLEKEIDRMNARSDSNNSLRHIIHRIQRGVITKDGRTVRAAHIVFAAGLIATFLLVFGIWRFSVAPPASMVDAMVSDRELQIVVRGDAGRAADAIIRFFAEGNYAGGIDHAEWQLKAFPATAEESRLRLLAGLGRLHRSAKITIVHGLSVDEDDVQAAITQLLKVHDRPSDALEGEAAEWALCRAYVLIGRTSEALPYLRSSLRGGSRYETEARKLQRDLHATAPANE